MGKTFERIALVKLSSLGDIVHALPVAYRLRSELPQAHITWIVEAKHRQLLINCPLIDELIILNKPQWQIASLAQTLSELKKTYKQLREVDFDLVMELQGLIKSGLVAYITGAKHRLGFSPKYCREPISACFTNEHATPNGDEQHIIEKNLSLIRYLGFATTPWQIEFPSTVAGVKYIDDFLNRQGVGPNTKLIGINPGAGWITKRWGVDNYARLSDNLISRFGRKVILIWGPGEQALAEDIAQHMRQLPVIACNTSVPQLIELIKRCGLFIAGDTGPLHLASALDIPTIALYGPSDPKRNGPYAGRHVVIHHKLECSGCYKRQCKNFKCMQLITVEEVLSAAQGLLD
jgi:heptosyltransferase-1